MNVCWNFLSLVKWLNHCVSQLIKICVCTGNYVLEAAAHSEGDPTRRLAEEETKVISVEQDRLIRQHVQVYYISTNVHLEIKRTKNFFFFSKHEKD